MTEEKLSKLPKSNFLQMNHTGQQGLVPDTKKNGHMKRILENLQNSLSTMPGMDSIVRKRSQRNPMLHPDESNLWVKGIRRLCTMGCVQMST